MFVQDGENIREEIPSMPGQYRWSLDRVDELLQQVTDSGVKSVLLFGIPAEKDEIGSSAWQPDGIVQRAVHHIKAIMGKQSLLRDKLALITWHKKPNLCKTNIRVCRVA